jgi:hypothetical protein
VLGAPERLQGLGLLSDGRDLPLGLFICFRIAHAYGASNHMGDWHVHRPGNTASYRFSYLVFSSGVNRRGLITLAFHFDLYGRKARCSALVSSLA